MTFLWLVLWLLLFVSVQLVRGGDDGPFALIGPVQTECEYLGLTVGTKLADAFNSVEEDSDEDRLHHDFMFSQDPHTSAFIKMVHSDRRRRPYSWGLAHSKAHLGHGHSNHSKAAVEAHGASGSHGHHANGDRIHAHSNASSSIFHSVAGKSIYLLGDSTLMPIYRALVSPIHSHDPKWDFHAWAKKQCLSQDGDGANPLGDNSLCRSVGYRSARDGEGELVFERQDYLLERLESAWLYNHSTLGILHEMARQRMRPDVLVIQLGRLSCFDAHNSTAPTEAQSRQPKQSENMVHTFMQAIKDVVTANRAKSDHNTTVIISLASRNHLDNLQSNICTWHMNRLFAYGAHYQGFVVLEREELEQRLLFKSEHSPHPFVKARAVLDTPPVPQILATSLLSIYDCIKANVTFSL